MAQQALVPSADDHTNADLETQGCPTIVGVVEDIATKYLAKVVAVDGVSGFNDVAVTFCQNLDKKFVGGSIFEGELGLTGKVAGNSDVFHEDSFKIRDAR